MLVAFRRFSLETSIWAGGALLLLGYLATRLLFWLLPMLVRPRTTWRLWSKARGSSRARDATTVGLLALANGDAARARKLWLASATLVDEPLLNLLAAARAAQQLGDSAGRDADLARASSVAPQAQYTIALTRAQLLIDHGDWQVAHALLQELREAMPRNTLVMQQLVRTSVRLRDGKALLVLGPALRKEKALPPEQIDALEKEAARW